MEIYLIRHTTPDVLKGTCYGQADVDTVASFTEEASCIRQHLPPDVDMIYCSPLKRCRRLAEHLFPQHTIQYDDRLKEINCGEWELRLWDEIEKDILAKWMDDFVNVSIPGGESYRDLYERARDFFESLPSNHRKIAIVSHGGVIRSLLSHIENVAMKDSFRVFSIYFGCVIRVNKIDNGFSHTILHNPPVDKEQYRPRKQEI